MRALHLSLAYRLLRACDILNRLTTFTNQPGFFALQGKQTRQTFQAHAHQPFDAHDFLTHQGKLPVIGIDTHIQAINLLLQLQRALGQDFDLSL